MDRVEAVIGELDELTTAQGFMSLCLELKSEMAFYEPTALVAMSAQILEGFFVNALAWAALEGDEPYEETEERLERRLREFSQLLRSERTALDARALFDRFLREGMPTLTSALQAAKAAFSTWISGFDEEVGETDSLISQCRLAVDFGDGETAKRFLAQAGVAILRGSRPRPVWLRIAGPITGWVNGLFAIRETMLLHPELPFPLGDTLTERLIDADDGVVDLRAWRNEVVDEWDDVDDMWQSILSDQPVVRREDLELLEREGPAALPILLVLAQAPEFRRTKAAFVALSQLRELRSPKATATFLKVVKDVPPEDPLFLEAKKGLLSLGLEAKGRVFAYLDDETDLAKKVSLGEIVARYHGDERAYRILTGLFHRAGWNQGKDIIARCLGSFGDPRAVAVLGEALRELPPQDAGGKALSQAIQRLKRRGQGIERTSPTSFHS